MPWDRIPVVHNRWHRAMLHFEHACAMMAFGLSVALPADAVVIWREPTQFRVWLTLAVTAVSGILGIIAIWRPTHRYYGLHRNSLWMGPP